MTPQTDVTVYTQELDRITFTGGGLTASSVTLSVNGVDKVPTSVTPQSIIFDNLDIHPGDGVSVKSYEYPDGWFDIVVGAPAITEVLVDGTAVSFDNNRTFVSECDDILVKGRSADQVQCYYVFDDEESPQRVALTKSAFEGGYVFDNNEHQFDDWNCSVEIWLNGALWGRIMYDTAYVERVFTNHGQIDFNVEEPSTPAPLTSVVVEGYNFKAPCELVYRDGSFVRIQPTLATDTRLEFYLTPALNPAEQIEVRIEATAVVAQTFLVIPQS